MHFSPFRFGKTPSAPAAHSPGKRPDAPDRPAPPQVVFTFFQDNPAQETDFYAVLGLPAGSAVEDVQAQYRLLAKRHHPDLKGGGRFWQEHFKRINAAHDFLMDPARKAAYDSRRAAAAPVAREAPPLTF